MAYTISTAINFDQVKEFMGVFAEMVSQDYGTKRQGITVRNPQANAIIEHTHQTIAKMIRTFEVQDEPYLDLDKPWTGIFSATKFAVQARTYNIPSYLSYRKMSYRLFRLEKQSTSVFDRG